MIVLIWLPSNLRSVRGVLLKASMAVFLIRVVRLVLAALTRMVTCPLVKSLKELTLAPLLCMVTVNFVPKQG